jgi:hypothetical protein
MRNVKASDREIQADEAAVPTSAFEDRAHTHAVKLLMERIGKRFSDGWQSHHRGDAVRRQSLVLGGFPEP